MAQRETYELDIVPATSKVLKNLKKSLAQHRNGNQDINKKVCVKLKGDVLKLASVIVREINENIINKLPPQAQHEYFLVESAEIIQFQEALIGN